MNKGLRLLGTSLLAVAVLAAQGPPPGPGGHGPGPGPGGGGPVVTGAPYSATRTMTMQETLANGNKIQNSRQEKIYRDADGRTRTESTMTLPSGETRTQVTIFDPVAGFVARLNPQDSVAMKMTLPPMNGTPKTPPAPPSGANAPTLTKSDLGSKTIEGLAATGTMETRTIPAGAMGNTDAITTTRETWISTALKVPVAMTEADPRRGTTTMQLTNISQTAPDPTLFQIPSTYTVKEGAGPRGGGGGGGDRGPGGPPPPDGSQN